MILSVHRQNFEAITIFRFEFSDVDLREVPHLPPMRGPRKISEAALYIAHLAMQLEKLHETTTNGPHMLLLEAENPR